MSALQELTAPSDLEVLHLVMVAIIATTKRQLSLTPQNNALLAITAQVAQLHQRPTVFSVHKTL